MKYLIVYLLAAGAAGSIMLCIDKYKATHDKWRIKERTLHIAELLGGIFMMLPTMHIIRHKCSKASYYWKSWAILALWAAALYWHIYQ